MCSLLSLSLQLEWIELQSEKLGRYQLNKYTGEIQRDTAALPASHAHPQIDLVNHAFQEASVSYSTHISQICTLYGALYF